MLGPTMIDIREYVIFSKLYHMLWKWETLHVNQWHSASPLTIKQSTRRPTCISDYQKVSVGWFPTARALNLPKDDRSTLIQLTACCLTAPIHYLNQSCYHRKRTVLSYVALQTNGQMSVLLNTFLFYTFWNGGTIDIYSNYLMWKFLKLSHIWIYIQRIWCHNF